MLKYFPIAAGTFGLVMIISGCTSPLTQGAIMGPNANQNGELQRGQRAQPASGSSGDLLYVAPNGPNLVTYYTYPAGELVGTLNATARGLCSDTRGNVFVINEGSISEWAHGGTSPIKTLGSHTYNYWSCSVDPITGNLAVTFEDYSAGPTIGNLAVTSENSGGTGIAIFKNATGDQTTYTDTDFSHLYFCGYDGAGNLFADGYIGGNPAAFAELPAGGSKLKIVRLAQGIMKPGQVQWDGKYLTVADEHNHIIYRVKIKSSRATVVGKTKLGGFSNVFFGSWIYGGTVVVPFPRKHQVGYVGFWNYPQGGSPTKTFLGPGYDTPDNAVTVSPGS